MIIEPYLVVATTAWPEQNGAESLLKRCWVPSACGHETGLTHTHTLTHKHFHRQPLLHTDPCIHTRTLLHSNAFTHRPLYIHTLLHADPCLHKQFYTQTLLHTGANCTEKLGTTMLRIARLISFYCGNSHTNFQKMLGTIMLWRSNADLILQWNAQNTTELQRRQKLQLQNRISVPKRTKEDSDALLHTDTFTHGPCYP